MPRLRRIALVCLLAVAGLAATATNAFATHFRYGSITWQIIDPTHPNVVKVRFESAWRWSFQWGGAGSCPFGFVPSGPTGVGSCPALNSTVSLPANLVFTGPGATQSVPVQVTVTAINSTEDWFAGSFETTVTLPVAGTWKATYTSSARISTLAEGNNDQTFTVTAGITVPAANAPVNQPPTLSTLPVVYMALNQANAFQIASSDPNGDPLTFSYSPIADSGLINTIPGATTSNGMSLSPSGLVSWTPHVAGFYATQVRVADGTGAYTVADFLIDVVPVTGAAPTVSINGSPNPASLVVTTGVPVSFTVSATSNGPSGNALNFYSGGMPVGSGTAPALPFTAVAPSTTFNWAQPAVGTYILQFSAFDPAHGAQDTNTMTLTVNKAPSDVTVTTIVSPTAFGAPVTFIATVHPHTGVVPATGIVQFQVDGVNVGSPVAIPANGFVSASITDTAALTGGPHTIKAVYPGDANLNSGSATSTHSVTPVNSVTTVDPTGPWAVGQPFNVSAHVVPASPGLPNPTGTVEFFDGALSLGTAALQASGFANVLVTSIPAGTRTITAQYNGSASYNGSSGSRTMTITKGNSTTTVTSSQNPTSFGQSVTFTAGVTGGAPGLTPTGTVQFVVDGVNAGAPVTLVGGFATFSTSTLSVTPPSHSIVANYSGDANYNLSQGSRQQNVNKASPTVTVTSDVNPVTFGQTVTFTATVSSSAGPGAGTVIFSVGSAVMSSPLTLSGAGTATFATDALNLGTFPINASFQSSNPGVLNGFGSMTQTVKAEATPPFSQPFPTPPGTCICTPLVMNTTGLGSQLWHAQAGGTSMKITVYASSVNNIDPESVLLRVFDLSGTQIGSNVTASYPAGTPQGTEVANSITFPTTAGTVYRVVVSTPGAVPTQPHYRLKFEGASEAAMSPINSLESVSDAQRWLFNVNAGEALDVRLFPSSFLAGATAANLTVQVFDTAHPGVPVPVLDAASNPVTTLNLTAPGTFPFVINFATPPAASSVYMVAIEGADGHYRIARLSGADTGIYLSWFTAGEGSLTAHVNAGTSGFAGTVQMSVTSVFEGTAIGAFPLPVGDTPFGKVGVGRYHIVFTVPAGYSVSPSAIDLDITCEKLSEFTVTVTKTVTTTTIAAPSITYGQDGQVTVSVSSVDGPVTGSVALSVDGGSPLTLPLSGGLAVFTVPGLSAGDHTLNASYTSDTSYLPSSAPGSIHVDKANPAIAVTGYSVTYSGTPYTATGTATGVFGESLAGLDLTATTHTNAGTYAGDAWTFTDVTGNYNDATGTVDDAIAKVNATIVVTPYSVPYDGASHTATGTATGVGGVDLSGQLTLGGTTHTNAGTYNGDGWSFAGGTNYNDATGTVDDAIAKVNATIVVTPYSVAYNGASHTATGTATGVGGVDLSGQLTLGATTHTNAGTTTDSWTFTDSSGNYNDASGSVTDVIAKVNATVSVTGYSVTYDGAAHTATGSATGVLGESLGGLNLSGTTHTNVGAYSDAWTFTDGSGNYNNAAGTVNDAIAKAATTTTLVTSATMSASGQSVTFTATVGSGVGVPDGTVQFQVDGVNAGAPVVLVGGVAAYSTTSLSFGPHTVVAIYSGSGNFLSSTSAPVSDLVYALTGGGNFVIGDLNAAVGTPVTFWAAQWEKANALSGPKANASFKGFANRPSTTPPAAGGNWTTDPGNSSNPPASIGSYIAVIVASTTSKSGSTISGNTVRVVIVRTNAGYAGDPGHAGTGTVVAVLP